MAMATPCLLLAAALSCLSVLSAAPAGAYPGARSPSSPSYPAPAPGNAHSCPTCVDSLLVVGDSFSDVGLPYGLWAYDNSTYPYSQFGYYQGRFTNGAVWIEYIEAAFNLSTMVNFAVGGSTINDVPGRVPLAEQLANVADYLDNYTLAEPSLGIISMGGDDIVDLWNMTIAKNATAAAAFGATVVNGTIKAAKKLLNMGLNNVVIVPSFVNLVHTPLYTALNASNSSLASQMSRLITNMTRQLVNDTRTLAAAYPNSTVGFIDLTVQLDLLVAGPNKYALRNVTSPCLEFQPSGTGYAVAKNGTMYPAQLVSKCNKTNDYLFWDVYHPSQVGHRLLAKYAAATLRRYQLLPTTTL